MLRREFWAWGGDYIIRDAVQRDAYYVDGEAFSLRDRLSLQDMDRNELAFIAQKLFSWGQAYELYRGSRLMAVVKKKPFTLFRCEFTIDVPGPDDLVATGRLLDHEFTFTRHGIPVAQASKRWFSISNTYGVEVGPGEDEALILAAVIIIDLICRKQGAH